MKMHEIFWGLYLLKIKYKMLEATNIIVKIKYNIQQILTYNNKNKQMLLKYWQQDKITFLFGGKVSILKCFLKSNNMNI